MAPNRSTIYHRIFVGSRFKPCLRSFYRIHSVQLIVKYLILVVANGLTYNYGDLRSTPTQVSSFKQLNGFKRYWNGRFEKGYKILAFCFIWSFSMQYMEDTTAYLAVEIFYKLNFVQITLLNQPGPHNFGQNHLNSGQGQDLPVYYPFKCTYSLDVSSSLNN